MRFQALPLLFVVAASLAAASATTATVEKIITPAMTPVGLLGSITQRSTVTYTDGECEPFGTCSGTLVNATAFQGRLDSAFSNCARFSLAQMHCDALREFLYALVKPDTSGFKCITAEDESKIFEVVALVMPHIGSVPPPITNPLAAYPPTASDIVGFLTYTPAASRMALTTPMKFHQRFKGFVHRPIKVADRLWVNGQDLTDCVTVPQYGNPNTTAFPACSSTVCTLHGVHPHMRAVEHEACCAGYPNEMGTHFNQHCWQWPIHEVQN
mmetsp:Transcript_4940/g.12006  ORF Transcript_4940/g.12006 Transcript_4940/m.12006 type:complete len:269 (-) Transcript_4940:168-974(-)